MICSIPSNSVVISANYYLLWITTLEPSGLTGKTQQFKHQQHPITSPHFYHNLHPIPQHLEWIHSSHRFLMVFWSRYPLIPRLPPVLHSRGWLIESTKVNSGSTEWRSEARGKVQMSGRVYRQLGLWISWWFSKDPVLQPNLCWRTGRSSWCDSWTGRRSIPSRKNKD